MLGLVMHSPVEGFQAPLKKTSTGPHPRAPLGRKRPNRASATAIGGLHNAPLDPILVEVERFWLDTTEVTREAYAQFVKATGYPEPQVDEDWAEEEWNWTGSELSFRHGKASRGFGQLVRRPGLLCMERKTPSYRAEWQRAALGTIDDETVFPWGNQYDPMALNHGRFVHRTSMTQTDTKPLRLWAVIRAEGDDSGISISLEMPGSTPPTFGSRVGTICLEFKKRRVVINPHTPPIGHYVSVRGGSYFFDFRPNPGAERNAFSS